MRLYPKKITPTMRSQVYPAIDAPVRVNAPNQEISKLLECPVCFEVITPPITLCNSGHAICNLCRVKMKGCPTCRGQFTDMRCRFAESFLDKCLVQCKYGEAGCLTCLPGGELARHQEHCDFRPLTCQWCEREIPYNKFLNHLRTEDKLCFLLRTELCVHFGINFQKLRSKAPMTSWKWQPTWVQAHNRDFFCFLEYHSADRMWFIWICLFGTAEESRNFKCSIAVGIKGQKTRLKYIGPVHPIRTSRKDVLESGNRLVFLDSDLKNLLCNRRLDVLVRIEQDHSAGKRNFKGKTVPDQVVAIVRQMRDGSRTREIVLEKQGRKKTGLITNVGRLLTFRWSRKSKTELGDHQ